MEQNDQRNFLLAIGLTIAIFMAWEFFFVGPQREAMEEARAAQEAEIQAQIERGEIPAPAATQSPAAAPLPVAREDVLAAAPSGGRIAFDGPGVDGSISLTGARIDDLSMKRHFETVAREKEVPLLSPVGAQNAFYAVQGWMGASADLPGEMSEWTPVTSNTLTPETPVQLRYEAGGLTFDRTISIDENYMFTIADTVANNSGGPALMRPFAVVRQHDLPPGWAPFYILHEGAVGVLDGKLSLRKYKKMQDGEGFSAPSAGGWLGLTTKYWMAAAIPDQTEQINAAATASRNANETIYRVSYEGADRIVQPGETLTYTGRIFAGAKRVEVLNQYRDELDLPRFEDAVDWGNFWFFTKPFFWALNLFNGWFGNFGLAILALTVVVKLAFFPMQNKAYESMAKMRKLMPEMEKIRERFAADKQRQQKEILELYQREKANPLAGCLPLIPQMFVFYGLYKTLFVTLEMRHEPFFGWINDLSAPDPVMVFNLFGLLPYDPSAIPILGFILGIGVWPVLYGVTMWALQSLSPPPPDPTQRMMMQFFPLVFTFIFAGFAAGLVIYWAWSNVLSIAQQYYIMRRNGVETQFDKFLAKYLGKDAATDA